MMSGLLSNEFSDSSTGDARIAWAETESTEDTHGFSIPARGYHDGRCWLSLR